MQMFRDRRKAGLALATLFFLSAGLLHAQPAAGQPAAAASPDWQPADVAIDYVIGADLSYLKRAEDRGLRFKDNDVPTSGMQLFANHGYNWVRLRLFHTPSAHRDNMPNDLAYTIATAQQAKAAGLKFLLNYHYSDSWADPGKQWVPAAWEGKTHDELVRLVREYTRDTMIAFREADVWPDMVQPGNEIFPGMMWPTGWISNENPDGWKNFGDYLKSAIKGVEDACDAEHKKPIVMMHIDRGGKKADTQYWFGNLHAQGVPYDVIGQSYYPWWHGSLMDLRDNMNFMATTYKKDIILVEVAYNWRQTNDFRDRQPPFPMTPEGQRDFLEEVHRLVLQVPDNRGKGIMWWEPAVPVGRGGGGIANRGMFDTEYNSLPVIGVFDKWVRD